MQLGRVLGKLFLVCFLDHKHTLSSIGITLFPFWVKEYSTLGGISLYCFLLTISSDINSFNIETRTASVILPRYFFISL